MLCLNSYQAVAVCVCIHAARIQNSSVGGMPFEQKGSKVDEHIITNVICYWIYRQPETKKQKLDDCFTVNFQHRQ